MATAPAGVCVLFTAVCGSVCLSGGGGGGGGGERGACPARTVQEGQEEMSHLCSVAFCKQFV